MTKKETELTPVITPLEFNTGREDLDTLVAKLNEVIEYINVNQ